MDASIMTQAGTIVQMILRVAPRPRPPGPDRRPGRVGRGKLVTGSSPTARVCDLKRVSKLRFTAAFAAGAESWGAAALFDYRLTDTSDVYWRWDRFANDPVSGKDIRAFNVGYFHRLGEHSRIGVDYQWKNNLSLNDDELNTQFSFRWNVTY
jgi:hypothetical protein